MLFLEQTRQLRVVYHFVLETPNFVLFIVSMTQPIKEYRVRNNLLIVPLLCKANGKSELLEGFELWTLKTRIPDGHLIHHKCH